MSAIPTSQLYDEPGLVYKKLTQSVPSPAFYLEKAHDIS